MEKNVSGVDLEELQKAREALDKERGVETDPNLYSDYNPNRETTQLENFNSSDDESSLDYDNITNNSNDDNTDNASIEEQDNNKSDMSSQFESSSSENLEKQTPENDIEKEETENLKGNSEENLSKFDIFAAFEVKENAPEEHISEKSEPLSEEKTEDGLDSEISLDSNQSEKELDEKLEKIENADELEALLSELLDDIDGDGEELTDELEDALRVGETEENEEVSSESSDEDSLTKEIEDEEQTDAANNVTAIDIEPKFEDEQPILEDEKLDEDVNGLNEPVADELAENVHDFDSSSNPIADLPIVDFSEEKTEEPKDEEIELEEVADEQDVNVSADKPAEEPETLEENIENNEDLVVDENINVEDSEESETLNENVEEIEISDEKELNADLLNLNEDSIDSLLGRGKEPEPVYAPEKKATVVTENAASSDTEIITDYSQLRDIFQQQLKETEVEETDEFKKKFEYKSIDDFKFIDEIASDGFKMADKFSYILGKNEKGDMVYGNFKEHSNLAIFGKNDSVTNSLLNSMILSLCLKNNFQDVNFVLLDSDINSSFEVYNKSSYLYFNRIAKTNKEILDTLIEVSKEVDARYEKFAKLGVKNIEGYNEIVKENDLEAMPQIILVFNNYTSASQATNHDRINACLYQILKYGRIAGIYVVVSAKLPIEVNQINYSLSSRISFKSDEDSTYTVGDEGVEYLPDESDAIYYNIASGRSEHVKAATVSDIELDIIIKDLEE